MSYKAGYKGAEPAPVMGGVCSKHGTKLTPFTRVCIDCHHEALEAAGFDWRELTRSV